LKLLIKRIEIRNNGRKVGLKLNASKTKIMELIDTGIEPQQRESLIFEKVKEFKCL